ncbi:MAG: TraR/DksA C4-type zinc finger protein [Myxococcales bacterium]|nr:TraR/DksA C4-type zinc finger protein [Myxococcales bacterium]
MTKLYEQARSALLSRRESLTRQARHAAGAEGSTAGEDQELGDIDAALARLDAGTYGTCQSCGSSVGTQRLRAVPETVYCSGCLLQHALAGGRRD